MNTAVVFSCRSTRARATTPSSRSTGRTRSCALGWSSPGPNAASPTGTAGVRAARGVFTRSSLDDFPIVRFILRHDPARAEVAANTVEPGAGKVAMQTRVTQQHRRGLGHPLDVVWLAQESGHAV